MSYANHGGQNSAETLQDQLIPMMMSSLTLQDSREPDGMIPKSGHGIEDTQGLDESSELSGSDEDVTWISWFCRLRGNEFFVEVDDNYVQDDFNLTGLSSQVPYYDYALDLLQDIPFPTDVLTEEQQEVKTWLI